MNHPEWPAPRPQAEIPRPIDQADAEALLRGEHGDPFAVLGMHAAEGAKGQKGWVIRVFVPGAIGVQLLDRSDERLAMAMMPYGVDGLFVAMLEAPLEYRLRIQWPDAVCEIEDPYRFPPLLGELDLYLFAEGSHRSLGRCLGAHVVTLCDVEGVHFTVWAPHARRVSVVGDFNSWDGRRHPMRRHPGGVWELFVPALGAGERYKFELLGSQQLLPQKADPLARRTEVPPATASIVAGPLAFSWRDETWMATRAERHGSKAPLAIYELHAGSWRWWNETAAASEAGEGKSASLWAMLAKHLIPYVREMGFTHIELMPIMEHPFGGSWGYQVLSQFAPTARYGQPADFAAFVDACHRANIGVILDWVPAHFPTDPHGLANFDGTALYEYEHPFEGFHQDWNTHIYNLGRNEVKSFMISAALHWLREFHIDGLRVDAVASMLYRDYSRREGEWIPNVHGGRENLEAIAFLRHLNSVVASEFPGAMVIAEESTAFPGVSHPAGEGGLGFSYKWNMGWMNDSLRYIREDPVNRRYHHHLLTFGLVYAFSEKFMLPISHDEVVHGKGSLLNKMPGDHWRKFANLRLYLTFLWTHPGKKLLFMGCEFGVWKEWNHDDQLDWTLLDDANHAGIRHLVARLNQLYRLVPALHQQDCDPAGFQWLIGDDEQHSVYAWLRRDSIGRLCLVVHNFTPVPRHAYGVGVPEGGSWSVIFNSDDTVFGGSGTGSHGEVEATSQGRHGQPWSVMLMLPPLGSLVLTREGCCDGAVEG